MRSVYLVALSKLRQGRKQNLLVGLSICLSVLLLTTAIGILIGINKPFDLLFDRLHASHLLLYYDSRQEDGEAIRSWFSRQPEVVHAAEPQHFLLITEPLRYKEQKIDIMVRITEMGEQQKEYDQLMLSGDSLRRFPDWGETWIPRHMALKYDIRTGDSLLVPLSNGLYPLRVSGIVVDPHFVSGLINPNRIWIAPGMLTFMAPGGEIREVMQGIRLRDPEETGKVWDRFAQEMDYSGSHLQYNLFKSVFTSIYRIIGVVIVLFSVLSIVISIYVISAIITNAVHSENRITGSLKALGFTGRQVGRYYMAQYLSISALAIPSGLLASYFAIRLILQSILRSMGMDHIRLPLGLIFLGSSLFFVVLIFLLIHTYARNARKIPPVLALRAVAGDTHLTRKRKVRLIRMERVPLGLWIALQLLTDHPRKAVRSLLSLLISAFILGFAINTSYSFGEIPEHKSDWGFDESDLQVSRATGVVLPIDHEDFLRDMEELPQVAEAVPYSYYELRVMDPRTGSRHELTGKVFAKDPGRIGLGNMAGRHPESDSEISLCIGTARELQKSVGDSVMVWMENEAFTLAVTGIYQDISNLGEGFRMSAAALKKANPLFEPHTYALVLTDPRAVDKMKGYLLERYAETIKIELTMEEQLGFLGITQSINAAMLLISLFFIGILVVSVFNDIFLNIWEIRKSIGVYTLIGFTHGQLRRVLLWKTALLSLAGILLAIPLLAFAGPRIMGAITAGMGIVNFPYSLSAVLSLLVYLFLLGAAALSTAWAAKSLKKISPRILVNE